MKRILFIAIMSIVCSVQANSSSIHIIRGGLQQTGPRIPSHVLIYADYTNGMLTVNVANYTGSIQVHVKDAAGNIVDEHAVASDNNAHISLDESQLPSGSYTLYIVLGDAIYYGTFNV